MKINNSESEFIEHPKFHDELLMQNGTGDPTDPPPDDGSNDPPEEPPEDPPETDPP